jgi:hypothetical protein
LTALSILWSAFSPTKQHLSVVLLDFIWRFAWTIISAVIAMFFGFGIAAQLGSVEWEGPDLGASNPIMVLAVLRQFWEMYGAFLLAASGLLLLAITVLWIVLESLFRGGRKAFWIYLGTAAARTAVLVGLAAVLGMLSLRDRSGGTFLISSVVLLGMWFIVGWLETIVRRDAVELFATDFLTLWGVLAVVWLAEAVLAFILWGSTATALLMASDSSETVLIAFFAGVLAFFWLIVHSYLVAVRYQAIDIMRSNVVRS